MLHPPHERIETYREDRVPIRRSPQRGPLAISRRWSPESQPTASSLSPGSPAVHRSSPAPPPVSGCPSLRGKIGSNLPESPTSLTCTKPGFASVRIAVSYQITGFVRSFGVQRPGHSTLSIQLILSTRSPASSDALPRAPSDRSLARESGQRPGWLAPPLLGRRLGA